MKRQQAGHENRNRTDQSTGHLPRHQFRMLYMKRYGLYELLSVLK